MIDCYCDNFNLKASPGTLAAEGRLVGTLPVGCACYSSFIFDSWIPDDAVHHIKNHRLPWSNSSPAGESTKAGFPSERYTTERFAISTGLCYKLAQQACENQQCKLNYTRHRMM